MIKERRGFFMSVGNPLDASSIFDSLASEVRAKKGEGSGAEAELRELGRLSANLFTHLEGPAIENDRVVRDICTIASSWRKLIREANSEIGSDINRLKLFHAFENVLDKVKVVMSKKQLEARQQEQEARMAKQNEGWLGWAARGVVGGAAAVASASARVFLGGADQTTHPQVTPEDVLEGIEKWQKFVKEADQDVRETDIRIVHLKDKVSQEFNRFFPVASPEHPPTPVEIEQEPPATPVTPSAPPKAGQPAVQGTAPSPMLAATSSAEGVEAPMQGAAQPSGLQAEEMEAAREFFQQVEARHNELQGQAKIVMEEYESLFSMDLQVDPSIMERGRVALQNALAQGKDHLTTLVDAVHTTTIESLAVLSDRGAFFATTSRELLDQSLKSVQDQSAKALKEMRKKANKAIKRIQGKMAQGGEHLRERGLAAIKSIEEQVQAFQAQIKKKSKDLQDFVKQQIQSTKSEMFDLLSPEEIFKKDAQSLSQLLDNYAWCKIPTWIPGVKREGKNLVSNLSKNLSIMLEDKNLQRIGVAAFDGLENALAVVHRNKDQSSTTMLKALRDIEESKPGGKISEALQIDPLTPSKYKKQVMKKLANRLGNWAVSDITSKWGRFKAQVMGAIFHIAFQICYYFLSKGEPKEKAEPTEATANQKPQTYEGPLAERGILFKIGKKIFTTIADMPFAQKIGAFITEKIGLDSILKEFSQQSDVVLFYMLDKVTSEMDEVLEHPGGASQPTSTGQRASTEEAQEVSSLKRAVKNFTDPQHSILAEALTIPLKPLTSFIDQQGDASSLMDMTTPIVTSLLPKWRAWLTA